MAMSQSTDNVDKDNNPSELADRLLNSRLDEAAPANVETLLQHLAQHTPKSGEKIKAARPWPR
jgi:hypothetical protein